MRSVCNKQAAVGAPADRGMQIRSRHSVLSFTYTVLIMYVH